MGSQIEAKPATLTSPKWLTGVGNAILDLLFPPWCVVCHRHGAWLCADCLSQVDGIHPPVCARCGLPLGAWLPPRHDAPIPAGKSPAPGPVGTSLCDPCQSDAPGLDGVRAFGFYTGPLRTAIQQFKYEGLYCLAGPLGELMGKGWARLAPPDLKIDLIVPVPLHRWRERERGYNQAVLLARHLGVSMGCAVAAHALVRTRPTVPQIQLSAKERRRNVHGAFACSARGLSGAHVLLVDDVSTTGSTLEAAGSALREGGAALVWAYTLARARLEFADSQPIQ